MAELTDKAGCVVQTAQIHDENAVFYASDHWRGQCPKGARHWEVGADVIA
ncbi:MAG: hypothetical protein ACTS6J_11795 [Burkholderiales bacterium]